MRIFGMWWNGFSTSTEFRPIPEAVTLVVVTGLHALALAAALLLHLDSPIRMLLIGANLAGLSSSLYRKRARRGSAFVRCVVMSGDGRWALQSVGGDWCGAALAGGWLAGPVAGLRWTDSIGVRRRAWLSRAGVGRVGWRRLRVRLRHRAASEMA